MPLHRAKIIARKAGKALVGENGADIVPALAMLTIGTLQQHFHTVEDARAILQQIQEFENDFLNDAFPGGEPPAVVQVEQAQREQDVAEAQDDIEESVLAARELAARIEAGTLRGADNAVQMFTIAFLATHLAVSSSDTIEQASDAVDAIFGSARRSMVGMFEAKQRGITRQ
jgi:hypothetical protein